MSTWAWPTEVLTYVRSLGYQNVIRKMKEPIHYSKHGTEIPVNPTYATEELAGRTDATVLGN